MRVLLASGIWKAVTLGIATVSVLLSAAILHGMDTTAPPPLRNSLQALTLLVGLGWLAALVNLLRDTHLDCCRQPDSRHSQAIERADTDPRRPVQAATPTAGDDNTVPSTYVEFIGALSRQARQSLVSLTRLAAATGEKTGATEERAFIAGAHAQGVLAWLDTISEYTQLQTGKVSPARHPFSLRDTVDRAIDAVAPAAEEHGIELVVSVSQHLPDPLLGDAAKLEQVLKCLLENAVACAAAGTATLTLDKASEEPAIRLTLTLAATTLHPEVLAGAGDPLTGALNWERSEIRLRFAIARQLLRVMRGELSPAEETPEGACLKGFLPYSEQRDQYQPLHPYPALSGAAILVADSSETSRQALRRSLLEWGMQVTLAESTDMALNEARSAQARGAPFPVVLIDHSLPPAGGLELAETLLEEFGVETTRVILLLPHSQRQWLHEPLLPGVRAAVSKPIRSRELAAALLAALSPETHATPDPVKPRILIAEDDPVNRRIAQRLLERIGYETDIATTGREALAAVTVKPYALIFMDCTMPEMDGFEATRAIRRLPGPAAQIPIVALTANALAGDRQRCLDAGMDDYISKPFAYEDLRAAIARWVNVQSPRAINCETLSTIPKP
jgi:CheY-like chemotaxis protein